VRLPHPPGKPGEFSMTLRLRPVIERSAKTACPDYSGKQSRIKASVIIVLANHMNICQSSVINNNEYYC